MVTCVNVIPFTSKVVVAQVENRRSVWPQLQI